MYYRYSNNYIRAKKARSVLSTFKGLSDRAVEDNLPIKYVRDISNFEPCNGLLYPSDGISEMLSPDGSHYRETQFDFDNIYPFYIGAERKILASVDGRAVLLNEEDKAWEYLPSKYFSGRDSVMFTIGERPSIIIPKRDGGLYSYDGRYLDDMNVPYTPTCMCQHMNRLFLVDEGDEYRVRFSAVGNPGDFTIGLDNGGEIYLDSEDGKIVKLISYNGNIYIFREYAIYRLTAFADQREFAVKRVACTTARISRGSIVLGDNGFLFAMTDGMHHFDGYTITKVFDEVDERLSDIDDEASAIFYNGKYYLSFGGASHHDELLIFNMRTRDITSCKDYFIKRFAVLRNADDKEVLGVISNNKRRIGIIDSSGYLWGEHVCRHWESGDIALGVYDKKKCIDSVIVYDEDRYELTISSENETKKIKVDGREKKYDVAISGYSFRFTIDTTSNRPIHSPILDISVGG